MKPHAPAERDLHAEDKLICAGLLGLCLTVVFHIDGIQKPDGWLQIALYLLAVSIPLLAASIVIISSETAFQRSDHNPLFRLIVLVTGPVLSFAGIDLFFWHMRFLAGFLFTVASGAGIFFWALFRSQLRHNGTGALPKAAHGRGSVSL